MRDSVAELVRIFQITETGQMIGLWFFLRGERYLGKVKSIEIDGNKMLIHLSWQVKAVTKVNVDLSIDINETPIGEFSDDENVVIQLPCTSVEHTSEGLISMTDWNSQMFILNKSPSMNLVIRRFEGNRRKK